MAVSGEHPSSIAAEAAEWHFDLQAGGLTAERRAAFVDWLRRSPVHVEEFLRVTVLQADIRMLPEVRDLDVAGLLAQVKREGAHNVIDFPLNPTTVPLGQTVPRVSLTRRYLPRGVAAAVVALLALGLWQLRPAPPRVQHYDTGNGEQRSVRLQDGSQVRINVRSDLEVRVDARSRDIQLPAGEALFEVAKDPAHPFRVHTPQAVIEARGTRFDVRVRHGKTVVVLLEGQVAVARPAVRAAGSAGGLPSSPVVLDPGETITVSPDLQEPPRPKATDVAAATAWLNDRLVFDDASLARVVEDFNMYSSERVVIDDPALGDIHLTASFRAGDAAAFARTLGAAASLRVTRGADGAWHLHQP